jgi:hypothetical protein
MDYQNTTSAHGSAGLRAAWKSQNGAHAEVENDKLESNAFGDGLAMMHNNRCHGITPSLDMTYDLDTVSEATDTYYPEDCKLVGK